MKFICSSQILSEACMNVQRATSTKSSNLPTIEGILIKAELRRGVGSLSHMPDGVYLGHLNCN